jgi:hypothetical protein
MTKDEPPRHKEHQGNLDEVSDASSERYSSLICLGDLGVLVV